MSTQQYVLAVDSGSSSARSVLVDPQGSIVSEGRAPVQWTHPRPGWAELDPVALWASVRRTIGDALAGAGAGPEQIAAVGLTTHRETVMIWDRDTGEPVHDAIVWISAQTDAIVERWEAQGLAEEFRRRTGLRNDSFFSAAKVAWLLEEVPGVRKGAENGQLACGTVDSWLLWNLTGGREHATDHSCASRTALFNLSSVAWDDELCALLDIPTSLLPEARPSDADHGRVDETVLSSRPPVRAVLADQQAGMFGQACFGPGAAKNTFGTAGVLTVNSGAAPVLVDGLTSSVAWTVGDRTRFELEGVVFHSGQTLQWLRDSLGLDVDPARIDAISASVPDTGGVYLVPAFGGMCAPHWDRKARASITGLSLESTGAHVVRAGLEAMAFQTVDVLRALDAADLPLTSLKVDGGGSRSDLLCQFLADVSGLPIVRPRELERTALGVAFLAGTGVGLWNGPDDVQASWALDRVFDPQLDDDRREALNQGWQQAVRRTVASPPTPGHRAPTPTSTTKEH